MTVTSIRVNGIGDGYDVVTQADALQRAEQWLPLARRVAVITNDVVAPLYLDRLTQGLEADGHEVVACVIPDGERHKTLETLGRVYDTLLPHRLERGTPLVALGGGVTTDLGGFAAATLLRGLPFVPVPTSLLAMVDASVGGKTGVNHAAGKNLIGAFHAPHAVVIDPATLVTLPDRELRNGLAECIKHDVIRDADHFDAMFDAMPQYLAKDVPALTDLVRHNVAIKARVVASDPFEKGERAHLNLGHTFGHAIEKVTKFGVAHGEAVAVGTVCACRASAALGLMSSDEAERVTALIALAGLPTGGIDADADALIAAMASDKKVSGGRVRFVLPTRIGGATLRDDVPPSVVRDAVASVLA